MAKSKQYNTMYFESKGFKKRMTFPHVQVSPNLAKELLELNTNNRPLKKARKKFADDMKNDKWIDNGDSLKINNKGDLIDGQNRLVAIIESGATIPQDIVVGLPPEAFQVLDIGTRRSKADTVAVLGYSNHGHLAALVQYLLGWTNEKGFHDSSVTTKITNQEIAEFLEELNEKQKENLVNSLNKGSSYYKNGRMFFSSAAWAFLEVILSRKNIQEASDFLHKLSTGDGVSSMDSTSAIYLCRARMMNLASMTMARVNMKYKMALCFKAWNYYRKHKVVKQLSWDDRQDFPLPV
jgi:hypothetical protein